MTRIVWARFQVPADATERQVSEALDLVFRNEEGSAETFDGDRRVVDAIRSCPPIGSTLGDLRRGAADCVHVSFQYGRPVLSEGEWFSSGDDMERTVVLGPDEDPTHAVLRVVFEPGTAIVMGANAYGDGVDGDGRRLDGLLLETEHLAHARMIAGERALHSYPRAAAISPWYPVDEPGMVAIARDLLCDGRSTRLVIVFEAGAARPKTTRHEVEPRKDNR